MAKDFNRLPQIIAELETEVEKAVRVAVEELVVPTAKALCPYDENEPPGHKHLRDVIHTEQALEGLYVIAGDHDVFFGHMVEHGTTHSAPRPFLVPALEMHRAAIVERAAEATRRTVDRG